MASDLRYAVRTLAKDAGFAVVATLTLALGIGANTAIFTVVNTLLLRPLPYEHSDRLVLLSNANQQRSLNRGSFSLARLDQLRTQSRSFEGVAGACGDNFILTGVEEPEQLAAARVSANFLQILGVHPILGRDFLADEDREGGNPVVMISYGLWQRRFGGNPNIVGSSVTLNAVAYMVIGVLPAGLDQPLPRLDVLATNLAGFSIFTREQIRAGGGYIAGTARLKPGVSIQEAQSEMDILTHRYQGENSSRVDADPASHMMVESLHDSLVSGVRTALLLLAAAVGAVLLISCANIASLLLARATGRRKEFAIRAALGASRGDLIRQLLTESLLLATAGGGLGLLIAIAGTRLVARMSQLNLPRVTEIHMDGLTLGFAFLVSIITGVLFGLAPSLQMSNPDLNTVLRESSRGTAGSLRRNRVRSLLVIGQVGLSMLLLIAASLLARSFLELQHVDPGFDAKNVLTMRVTLPPAKYPSESRRNVFFRDTLSKISGLPGVVSATAALRLPMNGLVLVPVMIDGDSPLPFAKRPLVYWQSITPDYFRTLKTRLIRGRMFTDHDNEGASGVAIVDETMARKFWPGQDPVGKRLIVARAEIREEVVGVVADIKSAGLDAESRGELYSPYPQRTWPAMSIAVRTSGDPMSLAPAVRKQIAEVDHDLPVTDVQSMEAIVAGSFGQQQLTLWLLGVFAVAALALAAIGIYGLLAYSVEQRRKEMGIRRALGAQPADILTLVLRQGLGLTMLGIVAGVIGALLLTRALSGLLFHVSPTDPTVFVTVSLLFMTVAVIASYAPARRALRVDPQVAMRE